MCTSLEINFKCETPPQQISINLLTVKTLPINPTAIEGAETEVDDQKGLYFKLL